MDNRIELNKENDIDGAFFKLENSENSCSNLEDSYIIQESLYGTISPAPTKHKQTNQLPVLRETLVLPKQRSRSNTFNDISTSFLGSNQKILKRPSTCGKEGIRHFSTPLPLKVKSLIETGIPTLSPDSSINEDLINSTFDTNLSLDLSFEKTPLGNRKVTSPASVRSFSSPLADMRTKHIAKLVGDGLNLPINSSLKTESELKREILKLQSEVNIMKKVRKYRKSEEAKSLAGLIDKWMTIAEMASNYVYNQAASKVSRMGGMSEFRKRQKKSKLRKMKFEFDESVLYRLEEYMDTEEFRNLDKYDQEELKSKKEEMEKLSEQIENGEIDLSDTDNEDECGDELTMKDLYKQLGLDYDLVYG